MQLLQCFVNQNEHIYIKLKKFNVFTPLFHKNTHLKGEQPCKPMKLTELSLKQTVFNILTIT